VRNVIRSLRENATLPTPRLRSGLGGTRHFHYSLKHFYRVFAYGSQKRNLFFDVGCGIFRSIRILFVPACLVCRQAGGRQGFALYTKEKARGGWAGRAEIGVSHGR